MKKNFKIVLAIRKVGLKYTHHLKRNNMKAILKEFKNDMKNIFIEAVKGFQSK
jgi:hypothetical protein